MFSLSYLISLFYQFSSLSGLDPDAPANTELPAVMGRLQLIESLLKKNNEVNTQLNEEMKFLREIIMEQAVVNKRQTAEILRLRRFIQWEKKEQKRKEKVNFDSVSTDQEINHSYKKKSSYKEELAFYDKTLNSTRQQTTRFNGGQPQKEKTREAPNEIKTISTLQHDKQPLYRQEREITLDTKRFVPRIQGKQTNNKRSIQNTQREAKRLLVQNNVLGTTNSPVAFQSALTTSPYPHIGINQNIVFDKVITNLGGGYNAHHGVFVAPEAGLYLLQASISSWVGTSEVQSELTVNGNAIVRLIAKASDNRHNQGSNMAIVQLKPGDDVAVRNVGITDDTYLGGLFTSFSGVLLQRM